MNDTETFLRQIAATQDRLLARVSTAEREATRLTARTPRRGRSKLFVFPLLLSVGMAAAAVAFMVRTRPLTFELRDGQASVAVGSLVSAPSQESVSLAFSDGSTMKLAATAQARVTHVNARGAAIVVERGRADISVVPRRGNDWGVDVGPFHVAVKGTRFSLKWDPDTERFDFDLEKGEVVITGRCLDRERPLEAGQSLHASCRWQPVDQPPTPAAVAAPASAPPAPTPTLAPAPSDVEGPTMLAVPIRAHATPAWRQLALAQRYGEALAAAERGGFANECLHRDAPDLLILGDVARLAGSPARATQAYTAARAKRTIADRSAFSLGLVEFDQRRNFRAAAEWFTTYLREQPQGPLAEQAEGRVMDAWQKAGEPARAREAGQAYLIRHPHGAYADLARRLTLR